MIQIDPENLAIKVHYTIEWSDCFGWGDARYRIYKRKIGVDIGAV